MGYRCACVWTVRVTLQIEERIRLFVQEIHYSDPSRRAISGKNALVWYFFAKIFGHVNTL